MFERQIEETITLLMQQTIGLDEAIHLKKIQSSYIPESIKRFYQMEASRWEQEEMDRMMTSLHFDYTSPEIKKKFEEISGLSREYTKFSRTEFAETLDRSVKLLFNYVCRPQWTLTKYIFADTAVVPASAVQEKLRHFADYEYFGVVIGEYISGKGISTVGKEKFEEIISLIDNEVVRNLDSSKLARLALPIFALFNPGDVSEFARVPVEALSIFYDDKNVTSVVSRLELEKEHSPSLSLHELMRLVGETDFTAGIEISEIVTRHVGGAPNPQPSRYSPEPSAASFSVDPDDMPPVRIGDDLHKLESASSEFSPVFTDELDLSRDDVVSVTGGEHETPDFSGIDDEIIVDGGTTVAQDFELPEDLFVVQSETTHALESDPEGLMEAIDQPYSEKKIMDDEDDFFKQLNLTDDDFNTPQTVKVDDEFNIPDVALSGVEDTAQPHSDLQRSDEIEEQRLNSVDATVQQKYPEDETAVLTADEIIVAYGDLRAMISAGDRKKFIKSLFDKNEQAYEASLDTLNAKSSWREASEHIDEIFFSNNVDMYSRVAVTFTDEIYKRYQKKKA
ncbi:MAG: hypothetical protein IPP94_07160 [Ignavibacteria bacterium]|nr:hypothetical protein [Ignavibacteria bacterium]